MDIIQHSPVGDRCTDRLCVGKEQKMRCEDCSHAEMCKWIDELEGRGCDFFDGEQEPTVQFDYVPIRETKGISCTECKYFKVTQEPLRGTGGLIDLGQARCEKHDLIKDFAHHGQFKNLKPCEYFVDFKEGDKK